MKTGKLPPDVLERMLHGSRLDASVLIGPALGEDAAAVSFGGGVLVATSDPITFATDRIGYYAVSVNANDIAAHGADPRFFLATILLPDGSAESEAESVFEQIRTQCERLRVILIGGHTEVTSAVDRVVVCGCMLGETDEGSLVRTAGAQVGDVVILAGGLAVEGTSILAREAAEELRAQGVPETVIDRGRRLLDEPGICIVDYARAAMRAGGVTSMHDPTEGGLATALRELAAASGKGLLIDLESVGVLDECRAICAALRLDPLGLIASGSLLIAAAPESSDGIIRSLGERAVPASEIGVVVEAENGIRFSDGSELPRFERDEIARYFDER